MPPIQPQSVTGPGTANDDPEITSFANGSMLEVGLHIFDAGGHGNHCPHPSQQDGEQNQQCGDCRSQPRQLKTAFIQAQQLPYRSADPAQQASQQQHRGNPPANPYQQPVNGNGRRIQALVPPIQQQAVIGPGTANDDPEITSFANGSMLEVGLHIFDAGGHGNHCPHPSRQDGEQNQQCGDCRSQPRQLKTAFIQAQQLPYRSADPAQQASQQQHRGNPTSQSIPATCV